VRKYVAHCLLLKQKQPPAASRLLSLQRSKRWDPWTIKDVFFYNQIYVCCVLFQPQPQPRRQTPSNYITTSTHVNKKKKREGKKKKKTTKWCETCDIALLPCNFISPFPDLKMTALAIHNLQYLFKKCYEKWSQILCTAKLPIYCKKERAFIDKILHVVPVNRTLWHLSFSYLSLFIKSILSRFYQGKFEFSLPFSSGSERSILVHFVRSVINNRVQVWHDRPQIKPIHNPWSQMVPQQNMKIDRRKIENKMSKQNMKIQRTKIENKMSY